jgi:hypothetical protein
VALFARLRRRRAPAEREPYIGDPRFDDWETVAEFEQLDLAQAFAVRLTELGIPNALTADEPLDRLGRGDLYLQVPPECYGDATVALDGLDEDEY